ncbi:hypothetical protein TNIN_242611 [Trichonephila inaurata madagascariensis]|uniref:Uncharacterized protein n=1 Tax=Trichonephila inaurata madagascariensis TaxID=2747483 RepID=A0A8X6KPA7_9ARAC|nr:hypothetical protein TNIN_242611 [Trichonephila inaurata madagascariensis]
MHSRPAIQIQSTKAGLFTPSHVASPLRLTSFARDLDPTTPSCFPPIWILFRACPDLVSPPAVDLAPEDLDEEGGDEFSSKKEK